MENKANMSASGSRPRTSNVGGARRNVGRRTGSTLVQAMATKGSLMSHLSQRNETKTIDPSRLRLNMHNRKESQKIS